MSAFSCNGVSKTLSKFKNDYLTDRGRLGIHGNVYNCFKDYFHDRRQFVSI